MMWGSSGWMGWGWAFGILVVIGVVLITLVVVRLVSAPRSAPPGSPPASAHPQSASARQILDERYAKGELTTEEYQERLRVLGLGS